MERALSIPARPLKRRRLLALALFAGAASSLAQDFYESRLRAGEAALDVGRAADAVDDLRIAAFGLLERPALLCEALANLALAEQSAGRGAAADAVVARLVEVERLLPACREARLDPRRRAELEALARRNLPASVAEQLLAAPKAATPARTAVATAVAPPAATPRPAAMPAAAPPTSTPVPQRPPATATIPPAPTRLATAPGSESPRAASSDELDRQPQLKTTTRAVYPPSAQRAGIGGVVLLSVLVSEKGEPLKVEVARSVQPDLDQAAVAAVRGWLFEPGRKGGAPVAAWMTVAVPFDAARR